MDPSLVCHALNVRRTLEPFFLESTFKDQINPKRQTAGPPEGGSPELDLENAETSFASASAPALDPASMRWSRGQLPSAASARPPLQSVPVSECPTWARRITPAQSPGRTSLLREGSAAFDNTRLLTAGVLGAARPAPLLEDSARPQVDDPRAPRPGPPATAGPVRQYYD
jgi:hypothetical protein